MGTVKTEIQNDIAVISWESRELLGGLESIALKDEVRDVLEQGIRKIVIDLSKLTNSNSTGLGILLHSWNMAFKDTAQLVVVLSSKRVKQIFNVTKLNTIMKSFKSVDDAITYYNE
ncbi:MAG: STAS domain-containing protein [bacterium]|nr:MAG: STAS domain-containing protein [bacterium]